MSLLYLWWRIYNGRLGDDGKIRDFSSILGFGRNGKPESLLFYSLLSPIRSELGPYYQRLRKVMDTEWFGSKAYSYFVLWVMCLSPAFAMVFLFASYLGIVEAAAENYFEHLNAVPGYRKSDWVSCYNSIYNFLWLNNSYHQEHHYRPGAHFVNYRLKGGL